MGRSLRAALTVFLLFTTAAALIIWLRNPSSSLFVVLIPSIAGGLTAGFVIFIIRLIVQRSRVIPQLGQAETIVKDSLATHGTPFRDAGGWLFLTNHNLRFKSHRLSSRKREFTFPLADIIKITQPDSSRQAKSVFSVHLSDGRVEQFRVEDVTDWMKKLKNIPQL